MPNEKFNDEQLRIVEDSYGIRVLNQELPELKTATNHVVIIQDDSGKKYVAKIWSNEYPADVIRSRLRIIDFMYDHGISTPRLLENLYGSKLTRVNKVNYTLTTFIEGRRANPEVTHEVSLAFSALTDFNSKLAHFKRVNEFVPLKRYSGKSLQEQFEELVPYLPKNATNEIDAYVLAHLDEVKTKISLVQERFSKLNHPKQLIHGNFNLGSTLIKDDELAGILDYNLIREDFRGVDAIHTLYLFCFEKEKENLNLEERVDWDKVKNYFSMYKIYDSEINTQIEDLPLMLANVGLNSLITTWGRGYLPEQTEKQREYFRNRYNFFVNRVAIALSLEKELIKALKEA